VSALPSDAALGWHVLLDLSGVAAPVLRDTRRLEACLRTAAAAAGASVLSAHFHEFGGDGGVTGVLLLSESHMTIHTWPEVGFAAVDAFMCGSAVVDRILGPIREALNPGRIDVHRAARGPGGVRREGR
jgi:S-adenosylmethionine decarboxylase